MNIVVCNKNNIKINTYIIKKDNRCIIIDPNDYEELKPHLDGYKLDYIFLTHEHFDHIMALESLRDKVKVVAQKFASQNIQSSTKNLSKFSNIILDFMLKSNKKVTIDEFEAKPADIVFEEKYELNWQGYTFSFVHTPGHSKGSCCILVEDMIFVGDSLFKHCDTNTRGYGASKKEYKSITIPFFNALSPDLKVYSGHDDSFILNDVLKRLNENNVL